MTRERSLQDLEAILCSLNELVWASELLDAKIKDWLWWSEELELMVDGKLDKCERGKIERIQIRLTSALLGWCRSAAATTG